MSRSAIQHKLARQFREGGGEAERDPLGILDALTAAAPPRGALVLSGASPRTCNLEPSLAASIAGCEYFRGTLAALESVEELAEHAGGGGVRHLEVFESGSGGGPRRPAPLFCCLLRLCTLRPTERQVERLLAWPASRTSGQGGVYVRALAALLLRYCCEPEALWGWLAASAEDDTPVLREAGARGEGARGSAVPLADWVRGLLTDARYLAATFLPRIPAEAARRMGVQLELLRRDAPRAAANARAVHRLYPGAPLRARYSGDGEWYAARVESVEERPGLPVRVWVVYPEFGADREARGLGQHGASEWRGGGGGGGYGREDNRGYGGGYGGYGGGGGGGGGGYGGGDRGRGSRSRSRSRERGGGAAWREGGGGGGGGEYAALLRGLQDRDRESAVGGHGGGGGGGGGGGSYPAHRQPLPQHQHHHHYSQQQQHQQHQQQGGSRSASQQGSRGGEGAGGRGSGGAGGAAAPLPPAPQQQPQPLSAQASEAAAQLIARYSGGEGGGGGGGAAPVARGDAHRHARDVDSEDVLKLGY